MNRYILCSAIWYDDGNIYPHQPINIKTGLVLCGWRHHNIITQASVLKISANNQVQGFLTNDNRFVNRAQAKVIALKSGQTTVDKMISSTLTSEDLW